MTGGSFGSAFAPTKPFHDYSNRNGLSQYFTRERLNAESIRSWLSLFTFPKLQQLYYTLGTDGEARTIDSKFLHSSPWYSLQLAATRETTLDTASFHQDLLNLDLHIQFLLSPSIDSSHLRFLQQYEVANAADNKQLTSSMKLKVYPLVNSQTSRRKLSIHRKVKDSR